MSDIDNILVGVDFSDGCRAALSQGARLAAANQAKLHVFHVIDVHVVDQLLAMLPGTAQVTREELVDDARKHLEKWVRDIAPTARFATVSIDVGAPARVTLQKTEEVSADLLVVGIRSSTTGFGAGALAKKAIQKAPTGVLLVNADKSTAFTRVVAGVDFSDASKLAARAAASLASKDGATLHLVHVFRPPWKVLHYRAPAVGASPDFQRQYRDALTLRLEAIAREVGGKPACHLQEGMSYGSGILECARELNADLVVVGTQGHTNLRRVILGSTADQVLRETELSVLAIKPTGLSADAD